jgi:Zn-dependent protease
MNIRQGSIHLFKLRDVDVYLHWSWFLIAAFEVEARSGKYSSILWNVHEYVALFVIVLLHEFGHAMACRQVGGTANQIVLWPLGGVAYVKPPQRPGATLWSIAAGPLVNVALLPVLFGAVLMARSLGWPDTMPDTYQWLRAVSFTNLGLLIFNMLPIYPLDGGQIFRSLLWFVLGRGRSLMVATLLGFVGVAGFFAIALWRQSLWLGAVGVFLVMNCWNGLKHARELMRIAKFPRRPGFACPSCRTAPPLGAFWHCGKCTQQFDTFASGAVCPNCGAQFALTGCLDCREAFPMSAWATQPAGSVDAGILGSAVR